MAVIHKLMLTLVLMGSLSASAMFSSFPAEQAQASVASMIRNATFLERTPEFTDLYIIKTWDNGRHIVIYCNSSYCYKRNGIVINV